MNKSPSIDYFRDKSLLPFQAEFAVSFLESKEKPYWQLVSPAGTGKTRVAGAIIAHELENAGKKRFLVLCPAALLTQWQSEISKMLSFKIRDSMPLVIDRKTYLELESRVPVGQNPWPATVIALVSIDLAKRDDMTLKLKHATWDLVVFDESQLLTGRRKSLFNVLTESGAARRILLLSATERQIHDDVATRIIEYKDVKDWDGRPLLYEPTEKKWVNIYYDRTKEEIRFLDELQKFSRQLAIDWSYGRFLETNILRAASSTIYATEWTLRRLLENWKFIRNKIAHNIPETDEDEEKIQSDINMIVDEPSEFEELPGRSGIEMNKFLPLYQKLEVLLDQIEEIPTDSKLTALIAYLRNCFEINNKRYICIWSSFVKTIEYLNSSVQGIGKQIYSLTGALEVTDRVDSIDAFRHHGGILIASDVGLEGLSLPYVDECINYDLPLNKQKLEQRWGRFLRLGAKREFQMVALRDLSKVLQWEEELINSLEAAISSEEE
ncbi:MAG: DEAD/DEAH box helicase [Thermodesulfobacteriota bacterium]|jgi:superfamily II DNA or RNA helicase